MSPETEKLVHNALERGTVPAQATVIAAVVLAEALDRVAAAIANAAKDLDFDG